MHHPRPLLTNLARRNALSYTVHMSTQTPPSTTVTVRLPEDVETQLAELAGHTRRSKSFLAREAITAYVQHELEIVAGVERGLADMNAGRVMSHDEAMKTLRSAVDRTQPDE